MLKPFHLPLIAVVALMSWTDAWCAPPSGSGGTWRWLLTTVVDDTFRGEPENGWLARRKNPATIQFRNATLDGEVILELQHRKVPFDTLSTVCKVGEGAEFRLTTERGTGMTVSATPAFVIKPEELVSITFSAVEHPVGLTAVWLKPAVGAVAGKSLVKNGDFSAEFAHWGRENWSETAGVTYGVAAAGGDAGGQAARIVSEQAGRHALVQRIIGLEGGRDYEVSCRVRGDGYRPLADGTPAMITLDFGPVRATPRPSIAIAPPGDFPWRTLRFTARAPLGTHEASLCLIHTAGTLWFDDVSVVDATPSKAGRTLSTIPAIPAVTLRMASGQTEAESIEIDTGTCRATISRIGGKISSFVAQDLEWCAATTGGPTVWAQGLGKLCPVEDADHSLTTGPFDLTVATNGTSVTVTARALSSGALSGVMEERTFTFESGADFIAVKHVCSVDDKPLKITPRIHNYLNFWRVPVGEAASRLYLAGATNTPPLEGTLDYDFPEIYEVPRQGRPWVGVVNPANQGFCLAMAPEEDDGGTWMCWSGFAGHNATLERHFPTVELTPGNPWSCAYRIHATQGLPSVGVVSDSLIASAALPDLHLSACRAIGASQVEVTPEGGKTQMLAVDFTAQRTLAVNLPALADPGPLTVKITPESGAVLTLPPVPRTVEPIRAEGAQNLSDKPVRHVPLSRKPPPTVGPGEFRYYYADYYQHEAWLSPDTPSMMAFGQVSCLKSEDPSIRLILDTPPGVDVLGGRFVEAVECNKEAGDFWRHRIHIRYGKTANRPGVTELVLKSSLPAATTSVFRYATEQQGVVGSWTELPVHNIAIPPVPRPKRLFTAFVPLPGTLNAFPDTSALAHVGFVHPDPSHFEQVVRSGALEAHNATVAKYGLHDLSIGYMRFVCGQDADGFSRGLDGSRVGDQVCPTYRGKDYQAAIEFGRAAIDRGILTHMFDPERTDGAKICFCERCLEAFRDYWMRHMGDRPYRDPRDFMKQPWADADARRAWILFKAEAYAGGFREYRTAMESHLAARGLKPEDFKLWFYAQPNWTTRNVRPGLDDWIMGVVESSLQDPRLLCEIFDVFAPMIYIEVNGRFRMKADMLEVADELAGLRAFGGIRLPVAATLSAGYPYTSFAANIEPGGMMRNQVLEAFAAGAKGVVIYSEGWFDALDMQGFGEAMRQIAPVEDVLFDGASVPPDKLRDRRGEVFVKGIATADDAVVLVSEYSERPRQADVEYGVAAPSTVVDLATGEVVATLTPQQTSFTVDLAEDRARLFHIFKRQDHGKE